jgi:hypothetical protein
MQRRWNFDAATIWYRAYRKATGVATTSIRGPRVGRRPRDLPTPPQVLAVAEAVPAVPTGSAGRAAKL